MLHKPYGRRRFLQTAALASTGLITSLAHAQITSAKSIPDEFVPYLIIGSGFGGCIAALRLAQAGISSVILERGRRWRITPEQNTFATFQEPDGRAAWLSPTTYDGTPVNVYTGVLELIAEDGINVLRGAGVGGGSLVYNAIDFQPRRDLFYRVFPRSIDYDELAEVYYPRVRSVLKPAPCPQDIFSTPYYDRARLLRQQADNADLPNRLYDIGVNWDIVRQEINGTKRPSIITGNHWFGVNSGAKNSVDRNYLAQAEQTGLVEVLPLHQATAITEVPGTGYRVSCIQINEVGEIVKQKFFTCRHLFLAAGSIGTSKLLVRAKATGALPKLNNYIGEGWAGNGDSTGVRSNLPLVSPLGVGGPSTVVVEYYDNPFGPIVIEDIPDPIMMNGTLQLLNISLPPQRGRFVYNASTDTVRLTWPADSRELLAAEYTYRILDKRNTTVKYKPKTELIKGSHRSKTRPQTQITPISAHPLGGAVLGKACDLYGRVSGYKGLYVVDSALIPGSAGCVNPALTVSAIAERCMDRIIAEDLS